MKNFAANHFFVLILQPIVMLFQQRLLNLRLLLFPVRNALKYIATVLAQVPDFSSLGFICSLKICFVIFVVN